MKTIEIQLGQTIVRARLLEERAPKTCEAIWNALPFGGRAVHAMLSGDMFRMLEGAPVDVDAVENGVGFQYPGLIVYHPPIHEIAFCYGDARFRGSAGAVRVTPIAEIDGDLETLREIAPKLQWDGATPIEFRRSSEPAPARPIPAGTKIEIQINDVVATATLLTDLAPRTCEAILKVLPLEGPVTNTKWSGAILRFWGSEGGSRHTIGINMEPENATMFHWPGYIYYHSDWDGIRICYGDGQQSGAFTVSSLTPVARFDGDWSAFKQVADNLCLSGAGKMSIRRK